MPIHCWMCQNCGTKIEVVRSIQEYDREPDGVVEVCACGQPHWVKIIRGGQMVVRRPGWGGGKGNW